MSAFALYVFGFIVFVAGVLYAEHLLHVPQTWVLVSGLVMLGLGVMTAVSHTGRCDPPSEAPPAPCVAPGPTVGRHPRSRAVGHHPSFSANIARDVRGEPRWKDRAHPTTCVLSLALNALGRG